MEAIEDYFFSEIPTYKDVEDILHLSPTAKINLANTKQANSTIELEHLRKFGKSINGINIEIDSGDDEELELLHAFSDLQLLRISFRQEKYKISEYPYFLNWLSDMETLKAISLETFPETESHGLNLLALYFGLNKCMPVHLFIKNNKRGNLELNYDIDFERFNMLKVIAVNNVELSDYGIEKFHRSNNILKNIEPTELNYKGEIEVEDNAWVLKAKRLILYPMKEIVFAFEGSDDSGIFTCEGRCLWRDLEGGFYFASRLPVIYREYPNNVDNYCSIKIRSISIDIKGVCSFKGEWLQNNDCWNIDGDLSK